MFIKQLVVNESAIGRPDAVYEIHPQVKLGDTITSAKSIKVWGSLIKKCFTPPSPPGFNQDWKTGNFSFRCEKWIRLVPFQESLKMRSHGVKN